MGQIPELDKLLENCRTVGISGHVHPDGDCVGSCLGLYLYLKKYHPEINVTVHLERIPDDLKFLAGADEIDHTSPAKRIYDVFFCLDLSELQRLGDNAVLFTNAAHTVCIDHHEGHTDFGDDHWIVPEASSASELVARYLGTEKLTKEMAEALYTGIVHDTGVFQYSCTSPVTMRVAAELMEKGIDFSRIVQESFFARTYRQTQILGRALLESILMLDGKVVFSAVREKTMNFFGVSRHDMGDIVPQLRNISGVDVAIFLYEIGSQEWKVSLRSTDKVDVAKIAAFFGGGGHKKAAGCTMQGSVYDVVNNLTAHIEPQLLLWESNHGEWNSESV